MLTRDEQDELLKKMFSPEGELRFNRGRISMNANDYARDWYSCDEVSGDFQLKYFNINRDKLAIIPFVRAAQKYNPDMTANARTPCSQCFAQQFFFSYSPY